MSNSIGPIESSNPEQITRANSQRPVNEPIVTAPPVQADASASNPANSAEAQRLASLPAAVAASGVEPIKLPKINPTLETVLVVDDQDDMRDLTADYLCFAGKFNILKARDGKEALQILEQAQREGIKVDLILSDLEMPNMNGIELAKARPKNIRMIITSGKRDLLVNENPDTFDGLALVGTLQKPEDYSNGKDSTFVNLVNQAFQTEPAATPQVETAIANTDAVESASPVILPVDFNPGKKTVLVVDDNPEVLNTTLNSFLRSVTGVNKIGATTREQALQIVEHASPDLLVLDHFLDGTTGVDLAQAINAKLGRLIPLIIYSGKMDGLDPNTFADVECIAALSAPRQFTDGTLVEHVERALAA